MATLNSALASLSTWELNWDLSIVLPSSDYKGSIGVSMDLLVRREERRGNMAIEKRYIKEIQSGGEVLYYAIIE